MALLNLRKFYLFTKVFIAFWFTFLTEAVTGLSGKLTKELLNLF